MAVDRVLVDEGEVRVLAQVINEGRQGDCLSDGTHAVSTTRIEREDVQCPQDKAAVLARTSELHVGRAGGVGGAKTNGAQAVGTAIAYGTTNFTSFATFS